MESERLRRIRQENAKFEQESPYNFCNRWCERCVSNKQNHCRLYLDEIEQKLTCIAHGREPDDPEVTTEVMRQQYHNKAHKLLEETFYKKEALNPQCQSEFEIVSWCHTLLPAKLYRALCGFHEPATEGDIALNDAVAQLDICKKAINESSGALRKIGKNLTDYQKQIAELIALLSNIHSRIEMLEQSIK